MNVLESGSRVTLSNMMLLAPPTLGELFTAQIRTSADLTQKVAVTALFRSPSPVVAWSISPHRTVPSFY